MTPEGKVKASVKKILEAMGAYHFMPTTGGYGRSGVPDIVGCVDGKFFAIECKAANNKPTALQTREMQRINAVGGVALLINEENIDTVWTLKQTRL